MQQAVVFGPALHVSSDDANALERATALYRRLPYDWRQIPAGLADAFINLMQESADNLVA
ncbi:MAG: hypothetical protein ACR2G0_02955 [Chthoniobacterales bacterium]